MKKEKAGPDRIMNGIYRVSGPDMTDPRDCASYLLDLGELVLIDSGSGIGFDGMVQNIRILGYDPGQVSAVIPVSYTHLTLPTIYSV
jgi:glyoxylase-like metal-dependent hydrolase (beta-lactamase superfamily II)